MKNELIEKHHGIDSNTKLYCIFGMPVKHSLSPVIHNAAFRACGLNSVYLAFEVSDIREAVQAMKALNIYGASVTIPHKSEVIKYIDYADPSAKALGAVNTLIDKKGKIYGYNTDGKGALLSLTDKNILIKGSGILLIGNGGSAKAIAESLIKAGAKITIAGRNLQRITAFSEELGKRNTTEPVLLNNVKPDSLENIDIIINTTPVGMSPNEENSPLADNVILKKHIVFDIVYRPDKTKLIKTAEKKGCRIVKGIDMLINQGALQFELWTGIKAPVSIMKKAALEQIKAGS